MGDRPSCFSACFIWACRYFLSCVILFMRPALFLFCWYCKSTITGSFFSSALSKTRWRMTKLFPASGIFLLRQPHNCAILSSVVDRSTVCQIGYGALAQLVARYIRIVEVTGSNPVCSTKRIQIRTKICVREWHLRMYIRTRRGQGMRKRAG